MESIHEQPSLEELEAYFANDHFARLTGCRILKGRKGKAVCEFAITQEHRNALGGVMGGAVFTLADYALAIASNVGNMPAVTVSSTIDFVAGAKGEVLRATCTADKDGRTLGFYTCVVEDDTGRVVARVTSTVMHVSR